MRQLACIQYSDDNNRLDSQSIHCAQFMRVSHAQSCGTGSLRGGVVKSCCAGPLDDWVLGQGQEDDVEVYNTPSPSEDRAVTPDQLTLVKIAYFFQHKGNRHSMREEPRPLT